MNILALDLSTKSSGMAFFENGELKEHSLITSSSTDLVKRIHIMIDGISDYLKKYNINKIIVEEVRPEGSGVGNQKTMKALMYLQAALVFLLHDEFNDKIQIEYIYPSSWRSACGIHTGRGIKRESLKQADIAFVKQQYNIDVGDDEADAISIGYAYYHPDKDNNELNWG